MSQPGALHVRRRRLMLAVLLVGAAVLVGRGFQLQVLQAATWEDRALRQQREKVALPAPRGTVFDRNGVPLATTREMVRVAVAPAEVRDREAVVARLREALGVSAAQARAAVDPRRRWVVLPGRHEPSARRALDGLAGIHVERVLERFHPHGAVALEVLGLTAGDGRALGGLELELDSLLRGLDGVAVLRRDAHGDPIPGALVRVTEPRPGRDLYLTLDLGLQEIAEEALRAAVVEQDAAGGDLIFADPRTGEILAAASVRRDGRRHWRGVTDPYEPGSTIKPFLIATLLDLGRASLADSVYAERGSFRAGARLIRDVHRHEWLTADQVLRESSNIGMVKLADRLTPAEHYAAFRDFGFGTPTGVGYPSESAGRLMRPEEWSGYSQASLAMGYELMVTPLQMTMAYGALANGGVLMQPRLVREVRRPDGRLLWRSEAREIRRVVDRSTADSVAGVLQEVVAGGTGRRAGLGEFRVAGKTGTARILEGGRYRSDLYTASFAGFFPARDPQLVFLVKLDRGSEYGGTVAAPLTRATLAAALAARATPLDRRAVAAAYPEPGRSEAMHASRPDYAPWLPAAPGPFVFRTQAGAPRQASPAAARSVPDVRGRSVRDAAAALHASGFRVRIDGVGDVRSMDPAPGSPLDRGGLVRLTLGRSR